MFKIYFFLPLYIFPSFGFSSPTPYEPQTISSKELINFQSNAPKIKKIIEMGLSLTKRNLTYKYGSAQPEAGGMDCSGTIYYLLTKSGIESVPRSSNDLYHWVKSKGDFFYADRDLTHLRPGDLLFWTGTYAAPNKAYVTHVMIYIGKNLKGESLMLGSSNGRTYKGKKIYGVSVFDFLPDKDNKFVGYSHIP